MKRLKVETHDHLDQAFHPEQKANVVTPGPARSKLDRCTRRSFGSERSFFFRTIGRSDMDYVDRLLTCADCRQEFIFTAGEQVFFFDKQFKNDPKRCKPCKSRRAGGLATGAGVPAAAGLSRTETRTLCSDCGIETTVPFKPTQGRPVLCRQCFQMKRPAALPGAAVEPIPIPHLSLEQATAELVAAAANHTALERAPGLGDSVSAALTSPQA